MKRFTETNKWDDPWFRDLRGAWKLVFLYVIDRCNNAGFWEVDEAAISWHTKLTADQVKGALEGLERGLKGALGWVWVKNFLKHQKNWPLNPSNPAHKQIIQLIIEQSERFKECPVFIEFEGALKGLQRPIGIGNGKVKEGECEGTDLGGSPTEDQFIAECELYSIPAFYARDKFLAKDEKGWGRKWKQHVKRISEWYVNDGRPSAPNGNGKPADSMFLT